MTTVYFRGSKHELLTKLHALSGVLAGSAPDPSGIGRGFRNAIGFAALSDIKDAYVTKARGGTDEMGVKWAPLAPSTIARRRVGPGDSAKARKRDRIQRQETRKALARFRLSFPEQEAQRSARIAGGLRATAIMGETKVETLGGRTVEILRDTAVMMNSLSPGELVNGEYHQSAEDQVFEVQPGEVIVGTNVPYAGVHQNGSNHIPARPFLPDENHPVPSVWWGRWVDVALKATVSVFQRYL